MIPTGAWLGVLGGGQLGAMFASAAQALGYRVAAVDADPQCTASRIADRFIHAKPDSVEAIAALKELCVAVTVETENIAPETLIALAERCITRPGPQALRIVQNRIEEKRFINQAGLSTVPYAVIVTEEDCTQAQGLFPGILKIARMGYDGKGQISVANHEQLLEAWAQLGKSPCVLEKRTTILLEISVILGRDAEGNTAVWRTPENDHIGGILDRSTVPARVDAELEEEAGRQALRLAEALDYVGVLCVEFFVVDAAQHEGRRLLVNELAPRPHNSGHYTIEACITSQFAQQARILAGLPLGSTELKHPAVMQNLVGGRYDPAQLPAGTDEAGGLYLHMYGKTEIRPGRKMGHITCIGADAAQALARGRQLLARIRPAEIAAKLA